MFHVLNRGVGRRWLFDKEDDFLAFERVMEETLRTRPMRLVAYCLLSNHWHFVLWPEHEGDLTALIQQLTNTDTGSQAGWPRAIAHPGPPGPIFSTLRPQSRLPALNIIT